MFSILKRRKGSPPSGGNTDENNGEQLIDPDQIPDADDALAAIQKAKAGASKAEDKALQAALERERNDWGGRCGC
jgi:hypothetical protein